MSDVTVLKNLIAKICLDTMAQAVPMDVTYLEVVSVNPLEFKGSGGLILSEDFVVLPEYLIFSDRDIGKRFVFLKKYGGQLYFYLYAPKGIVKEYDFDFEIDNNSTSGYVSGGSVVVNSLKGKLKIMGGV